VADDTVRTCMHHVMSHNSLGVSSKVATALCVTRKTVTWSLVWKRQFSCSQCRTQRKCTQSQAALQLGQLAEVPPTCPRQRQAHQSTRLQVNDLAGWLMCLPLPRASDGFPFWFVTAAGQTSQFRLHDTCHGHCFLLKAVDAALSVLSNLL
jgi:hypothetical protein